MAKEKNWSNKVKFKQNTKYEGSFINGKENGFSKLFMFSDDIPDYFEEILRMESFMVREFIT